jgi:hypothetical protein
MITLPYIAWTAGVVMRRRKLLWVMRQKATGCTASAASKASLAAAWSGWVAKDNATHTPESNRRAESLKVFTKHQLLFDGDDLVDGHPTGWCVGGGGEQWQVNVAFLRRDFRCGIVSPQAAPDQVDDDVLEFSAFVPRSLLDLAHQIAG